MASALACAQAEPTVDELAPEVEGQPLDRSLACPDLHAPTPARYDRATLRELGSCGDLLIERDGVWTLIPVDGEAEDLPAGEAYSYHALSPRGRLLLSHDYASEQLTVRALGPDGGSSTRTLVNGGLGETARFGFVISKLADAGAIAWVCDGGELGLIELESGGTGELVPLASAVVCETVVSAAMHSRLAFTTDPGEVYVADVDAQAVTAVALAGVVREPGEALGTRRDSLRLSTTGPYLVHVLARYVDSDGFTDLQPFGERLYDLDREVVLVDEADELGLRQAAVFGAPAFVTVDETLSGVRDGELVSIRDGVDAYAARTADDGSVVLVDGDGSVVRYTGERWDQTRVELPAAAGQGVQGALQMSPGGAAGIVERETEDCATPACETPIWITRAFGPDGPGPELEWAGNPQVLRVFDDGAALVSGRSLADGAGDSLPTQALVLLDADGEVLATHTYDELLIPRDPAALADERLIVALGHFQASGEVVLIDRNAGTIEAVAALDPTVFEPERVTSDALGRRVAVQLSGTGGVLWGEL